MYIAIYVAAWSELACCEVCFGGTLARYPWEAYSTGMAESWRDDTEDRERMCRGVRLRGTDGPKIDQPRANIERSYENPLGLVSTLWNLVTSHLSLTGLRLGFCHSLGVLLLSLREIVEPRMLESGRS